MKILTNSALSQSAADTGRDRVSALWLAVPCYASVEFSFQWNFWVYSRS
ncbi:hypothetical protein [Shewanella sp. Scap07]|nr:hypothetical protein [Shewanella sp. Scap07]